MQLQQPHASPPPLWTVLAEFPLFVLRAFFYPRSLARGMDWESALTLQRLALYTLIWLALLTIAFSNNRVLANKERPLLSSFKGVVMRAHDKSWDNPEGWQWLDLAPFYTALNHTQPMAKRLWDTMLTTGFVIYTLLAALAAIAIIARLRMWRFGMSWNYALGTGLLGYLPAVTCMALSLVPLALLLLCRHCGVRLGLFILLNFAGWAYLGYYTLADLGERPHSGWAMLLRSLGWGFVQYVAAYIIFLVLIAAVIPI